MRGKVGWLLWIAHELTDRLGLSLLPSQVRPIPPVALARPMKGWPCGVTGPRPRARPSHLLVDPGDIYPPQAPNLWDEFEIISPKILGPVYGFCYMVWFLLLPMGLGVAPELWVDFLEIIHSKVFILCFRNQHFAFVGLKIYCLLWVDFWK
jgi:hypothetical protein